MKWEYMRRTFSISDNPEIFVNKLNELGDDSWELVSTITIEEKVSGCLIAGPKPEK